MYILDGVGKWKWSFMFNVDEDVFSQSEGKDIVKFFIDFYVVFEEKERKI